MAEFCKKHAIEFVGDYEHWKAQGYTEERYKLLLEAWTCEDGYCCEECGYEYCEEEK